MTPTNPYAPPVSAVADIEERVEHYQPVRLFSATGRIGRLRYLANMMVAYLLVVVGAGVLGCMFAFMQMGKWAGVWAGVVALVPYFVFLAFKTVQRSHDMDWSGWSSLLAFIPFVGLIWIFKGGTAGSNRFGAPPPPNTTLVKIGGLAFPVIAVIGIVAAVALPAYQDYTKRAKAIQMK